MPADLAHVTALLKIILFDLVLSGDNAVVIGLAAHRLPARQRKQAMIWGCGLAIVMRVGLTLIVSYLVDIPGLRFVGALLLVWIACKLLLEEVQAHGNPDAAPTSLFQAIRRIAMADFIMSLDNVLAIAVAAQSPSQIIIGLALSIMMLLFLSAIITEIMNRYRWIVYAGAGLLASAAADMMAHDLAEFAHRDYIPDVVDWHGLGLWTLRVVLVVFCLTINFWIPKAKRPVQVPDDVSTTSEVVEPTGGRVGEP